VNTQKWITWLAIVVIVGGVAFWYFTTGKASANVSDKDLITAQRVDFPLIVSATGALEATKSVGITPPQGSRQQRRFKLTRMVDEGTNVSEGDFVMEFDTSDLAKSMRDLTARFQKEQENRQNKRSNFDLNLKNQKLSLEQAKSDLQKLEVKITSQADLLSGIEVEKTRIQRDASRKNVEYMEKKIELMTKSGQLDLQISSSNEKNYSRQMDDLMDATEACIVRAPISGVVIYKRNWNNEAMAVVGGSVTGNNPIMEIPDLSTIRARVQIDEVDSGKIKLGQDATISVSAVPGQIFGGKVTSTCTILKQLDFTRPQKTCDTYVDLESVDMKHLRPGMNLSAKVMVGQYSKVVVIPLSSIQERDGRSFVQVWQPEAKSFTWREIQLKTNDGLTAVVESGLNANEKIRVKPKA
jgi:HlyD family secretion protein